MAATNLYGSTAVPALQPRFGTANPHLQRTDQMMAAQLAALGTNPQAMALSQRFQDAAGGEQANMEAMQNIRGGWGEALSRLGAQAIYESTKRSAASGISNAYAAQQQGIRSADDAALGLSTPAAGAPASLPATPAGTAQGTSGPTANDNFGGLTQALSQNLRDYPVGAATGPAQTGADLSAKFAQPGSSGAAGHYGDVAQALLQGEAPPLPPVGSPEHTAAFNAATGNAPPPGSAGELDHRYAQAISQLNGPGDAGTSTAVQPSPGDLQMASLIGGDTSSSALSPASLQGSPSRTPAPQMLALPAPNVSGQPAAPPDPFGPAGAISQPPPTASSPVGPNDLSGRAFNYFTSRGFSPSAAAGIVGGFHAESLLNPGAYNAKENAVGLGQWRGPRLAALQSFARSQGTSPQDFDTQLAFTVHELGGPESHAAGLLRTASDPIAGAAAMNSYLRPQGYAPGGNPAAVSNWRGRSGAAVQAARMYGGQGQDTLAPSRAAPAPQPQGASALPMSAPGGAMQPPPPADPFAGAAPQPSQPQAGPQPNPYGPTDQQRQLYLQLANSPNPQDRIAAHEYAMKLREQMAPAPAWEGHFDATTGMETYTGKGPGQTAIQQGAAPGYVAPAPDKMQYDAASGRYVPKPGTMQSQPRQLSPSAFETTDPFGVPTVTSVPGRAADAPAGTVWDEASHSYVPLAGAQTKIDGQWQPGTVTATKPNGDTTVVQGPAYTADNLLAQRKAFKEGDNYKQNVNTVNALNSLYTALATAQKNNGFVDMAAVDNLVRAQTGLSARQGNVQLLMSHLGVPQEVLGAVSSALDKGPLTPQSLRDGISVLQAYTTTHQATAQHDLDEETALAKRYGYDFGVTLPRINPQPRVAWLDAPAAPQAPASPAAVNPMRGATHVAPAPPAGQRQAGQVYMTPRGPMRFTGTGWAHP